jgi:hypothetical protein
MWTRCRICLKFVLVRAAATDVCSWNRQVVSDLMATLMREGDKGMEKVLATSAPGNPFTELGYEKVRGCYDPSLMS